MQRIKLMTWTGFILLWMLCSCNNPSASLPVVDFSCDNLRLDSVELAFIPLETSSKCLLSSIEDVSFYNKRIFVNDIQCKGIYAFTDSGHFIGQIGKYGNGPGEYLMAKRFYIDTVSQKLTAMDFSQSKMIDYDLKSYQYLSSHKANVLTDCTWLPDGNMAWFDLSGYENTKRKHFYVNITDQNLKSLRYGFETKLTTGYLLSLGKRFFENDNHHYLAAQFNPIAYEVSTDTIKPVYQVSFGQYKFPPADWLSTHINEDDNYLPSLFKSPYICAFNLNETSDYLLATFLIHGNQDYYAIYNKKSKHSRIYTNKEFCHLLGINGLNTIIGTYNNYFVCSLSTALLKRSQSIGRADLRNIANKLSEEDNPIICMFKFQ